MIFKLVPPSTHLQQKQHVFFSPPSFMFRSTLRSTCLKVDRRIPKQKDPKTESKKNDVPFNTP